MPIVLGTTLETTIAANAIMAQTYRPRAKRQIYPKLASSYISVKPAEPFSIIGAAPPLRLYNGGLSAAALPSFSLTVPNLLFKNILGIGQQSMEFDQTRTIKGLAQWMGQRLAEFPDQLFFKRILNGSNASSVNVPFNGQTYQTTFDGVSLFNTAHPTGYNGATQSNIIQGSLPATRAAIALQDPGTTASQILADTTVWLDAMKTVVDTQGMPMYPNLDSAESVIILAPPCLAPAMDIAFKKPGSIVQQTTNVGSMYVKDVITSGYCDGFPDPEPTLPQTTISNNIQPVNQTDYYAFIVDDIVKPFYVQLFKPISGDEMFPRGYDADAVANAVRGMDNAMTVEQAVAFASTRIDTTFNKVGNNSDFYTMSSETFWVSTRMRGNIAYGPHMLSYRIKPVGGN